MSAQHLPSPTPNPATTDDHHPSSQGLLRAKETSWLEFSGAPAPSFHPPVVALSFLLSTSGNSLITSRLQSRALEVCVRQLEESGKAASLGTQSHEFVF